LATPASLSPTGFVSYPFRSLPFLSPSQFRCVVANGSERDCGTHFISISFPTTTTTTTPASLSRFRFFTYPPFQLAIPLYLDKGFTLHSTWSTPLRSQTFRQKPSFKSAFRETQTGGHITFGSLFSSTRARNSPFSIERENGLLSTLDGNRLLSKMAWKSSYFALAIVEKITSWSRRRMQRRLPAERKGEI